MFKRREVILPLLLIIFLLVVLSAPAFAFPGVKNLEQGSRVAQVEGGVLVQETEQDNEEKLEEKNGVSEKSDGSLEKSKEENNEENNEEKPELETSAESAILMDDATGKILFAKEPHKKLPMASVTKIMTTLLVVEAIERGEAELTDKVVTSDNAWSMGGSQVYLEPGEEMSLEDMLLAVAVGSANDASVAVGEHIAGSEEAFVEMMNKKAQELGMKNTHFVNPTGLPAENHYTTAYDMALLMREALKHSLYMKYSAKREHDLRDGEFKLWNRNKLLWWYKGVDAGKTGWTNEAKYCLASSAKREGLRLIAVVLGVPETKGHFKESIKLYNYGFARYKAVNLAEKGAKIKSVSVDKGITEKVDIVTADKVSVVVKKGEDKNISSKKVFAKSVTAPVKKGQKLGEFIVSRDGEELLKVDLVAGQEVPKASISLQMFKVMNGVLRMNYNS